MKKIMAYILCAAMLLSLWGCGQQTQTESTAPTEQERTMPELPLSREATAEDAQGILEYLTSPQLQGRSLGSQGNEAAARSIGDLFQSLGYGPFSQEYCIPYADSQIRPELAKASFTLISPDGKETALTPGQDFTFFPSHTEVDVTLPLSDDQASAKAQETIYYSPSEGDARTLAVNDTGAICLECTDLEEATTLNNNVDPNHGTFFQIDSRFAEVLSQPGVQAKIHLEPSVIEGEALNVAAIRRGKVGTDAVIISAHFDGSGTYGDVYYPSAYDNASGTTAMLLTARLLADSQLDADLIFAAFNGEEEWLHGSAALAQTLAEGYNSITVINIDCVGLATENGYTLSGNTAEFSRLAQMLDNYAPCNMEMASDHMSFDGIENAVATNLADRNAMDYAISLMHTRGDTADKISPQRLLHTAQLVAQYVQAQSYPARGGDISASVFQYEIPYKLAAKTDLNTDFFLSLPRTFGTALDRTYGSYEELEAELGVSLVRTEVGPTSDGIGLSIWSVDDQEEAQTPAYDVTGYFNASYDGHFVWNEIRFVVGQDVDSSSKVYGEEEVTVTQSTYAIASLGVEATVYQVDEAGGSSHVTATFVYDDVLYTCELESDIQDMHQYLELFHA